MVQARFTLRLYSVFLFKGTSIGIQDIQRECGNHFSQIGNNLYQLMTLTLLILKSNVVYLKGPL